MTKIKRLKNKVKIEFEHALKGDIKFAIINTDGLVFNVFLKNGQRIYADAIDHITLRVKETGD